MSTQRFILLSLLLFTSSFAHAQIEWPVLYATRAVKFTEALVDQCNASAPGEASSRLEAFQRWRARNERQAAVLRAFNMERIRKDLAGLELAELELELDKLQNTALTAASKDATMCVELKNWLGRAESEPRRQVSGFMQPPILSDAPPEPGK
mgnify:CR=1 FL=1